MRCRRREARDTRARSCVGREDTISTQISSGMWGVVGIARGAGVGGRASAAELGEMW